MATRADIRDAFTSELKTVSGSYDVKDASGTTVDTVTLNSDDVGLRNPEQTEPFPSVVYHEDYRRVIYNGVGAGPDAFAYNNDGSVNEAYWREYMEAQFIVDVRAQYEAAKEPIYEALRSRFAQYQFNQWDEKTLNGDITKIEVVDARSVDTGDTEDVIRGDQLEVRITFYRNYTFSTDNITTVDTAVDADLDGIVDYTYTTT